MALPVRTPNPRLSRADLPAEFTPDTVRELGLHTLRQLARRGNGVLDAEDQRRFDAALAEVSRGSASLVDESLRRARHAGPSNLDPTLRRSYQRAQQRLAEQARRVQDSLPELTTDGGDDHREGSDGAPGPDVSPGTLEQQVEQTSDTLDLLEKIASLQQQQVEHQRRQLLSETRGFFFAFLVSVAVIVAGVAPLVEAEPDARVTIALWTVITTTAAGLVYALVRVVQSRRSAETS